LKTKTKTLNFEMATIQQLESACRDRAEQARNSARDVAAYANQGFTQGDWRSPHLQGFGTPNAPQITQDIAVLQRNGGGAPEGGALSQKDVNHFLTIKIQKLKQGEEENARRGVKKFVPPALAAAATAAATEADTMDLQETLSQLQRLLESGIASGKLLEKGSDLLSGVAKLAAVLSPAEAADLAQGIRDAAQEAEASFLDLDPAAARSKNGQLKEATSKLLWDTLSVLEAGVPGPSQDRAARVAEQRRIVARRPGRDTKRRRDELREALAADAAVRAPEAAAAIAEAQHAEQRVRHARDEEAAQEVADRARAVREARAAAQRRGRAAGVGPATPIGRVPASPLLQRLTAQRQRAEDDAEAAADRAAPFDLPRLPARGTEPFRRLVQHAFDTPRVAALRALADAYGVHIMRNPTKEGLRAALLV
jgi:hypothetical protein